MSQRPKVLLLYSFIAAAIALSFPLQIIYLFELDPISHFTQIWTKLTFANWAVMFGLLGLSYTAFHADQRLNWLIPANIALVALNNYWVGSVAETYSQQDALLATASFSLFAGSPYMFSGLRQLLVHPDLRWWRSRPRTLCEIPVRVQSKELGPLPDSYCFDISDSGMFLQMSYNDFHGLKPGDKVSLEWSDPNQAEEHRLMMKKAEVVRLTEARGRYPRGVGLRFAV